MFGEIANNMESYKRRLHTVSSHLESIARDNLVFQVVSSTTKVTISSHVLDTNVGTPAPNMKVKLEKQEENGNWNEVITLKTNADGRITGKDFPVIEEGNYRVTFFTEEYFLQKNIKNYFYPYVTVNFITKNGNHYHVPLIVSPFGYSTYRLTAE